MDKLPVEPKKMHDSVAIWMEMEELRARYGALSLGQGSPGYEPPKFLRDSMMEAIDGGFN